MIGDTVCGKSNIRQLRKSMTNADDASVLDPKGSVCLR